MRVFVGVEVDARVQHEAERVVSDLQRRIGSRIDSRWVPLDNLHLTVRFIGHVPDDRSAPLLAALDQPLSVERFDIEFGGCGRFPPRGAPRVLWIGISRGLRELTAVHDEYTRRVAPFGYEPEDRPFSAHLTLARIKDAPAGSGRSVDAALSDITVMPIVQRVDHVTVFESRLSPKGPTYMPLRHIPLREEDSGTAN